MTVKYYLEKKIEDSKNAAAINLRSATVTAEPSASAFCKELAAEDRGCAFAYRDILGRLPQSVLDAEILTAPRKNHADNHS